MADHMTFTEFTDFILARLYELDARADSYQTHDIVLMSRELRNPVRNEWPKDAVDVLVGRGLAKLVETSGGRQLGHGAVAGISGEGRLYVEGREHRTKIIEEYRRHPANLVFVGGERNQVSVGTEGRVTQVAAPSSAEAKRD
jgi:hypothetical protein